MQRQSEAKEQQPQLCLRWQPWIVSPALAANQPSGSELLVGGCRGRCVPVHVVKKCVREIFRVHMFMDFAFSIYHLAWSFCYSCHFLSKCVFAHHTRAQHVSAAGCCHHCHHSLPHVHTNTYITTHIHHNAHTHTHHIDAHSHTTNTTASHCHPRPLSQPPPPPPPLKYPLHTPTHSFTHSLTHSHIYTYYVCAHTPQHRDNTHTTCTHALIH